MSTYTAEARTSSQAISWPRINPRIALLVGVPLALLAVDPKWAFTASTYTDPWYYFGYFQFLPQHLQDFPRFYYSSRLPWLLPGWLAYLALPPVVANDLLHVGYHLLGTLAMYALVARVAGSRAGLVCAALMATYGPFLQAVGWDYADGPAIAYFLVTLLCFTRSLDSARPNRWLVGAGCSVAMLVFSNVYWITFTPAIAAFAVCLGGRARVRAAIVPTLAGGVAVTLVLCAVNTLLAGEALFFMPSVRTAGVLVRDGNQFWLPLAEWLSTAAYLALPLVMVVPALIMLRRARRDRFGLALRLPFVIVFGVLLATQVLGQASLQLHYYASALIPSMFLSLAADLRRPLAKLGGRQFALLGALAIALPVLSFSAPMRAHLAPLQTGTLQIPLLLVAVTLATVWLGRGALPVLFLALLGWTLANLAIMDARVIDLRDRSDKVAEFQAIAEASRAIRAANPERFSRVWYDHTSPLVYVYEATASTHLAGFADIERDFPSIDSPDKLRGSRVALLSSDLTAPERAEASLRASGLSGTIVDQHSVDQGSIALSVTTIQVTSGP
jgi:dolichyl-phosphate-mannose-protein mannosyltransferase